MILENHGGEYYHCRIPSIAKTDNNSVIACYECRKTDSDWSDIDLKIIRSTDKGETWQTVNLIKGNGNTMNNPVLTVCGNTIHFIYCKNYMQMFHIVSTDDGINWTDAKEITSITQDIRHTVVATGPGHGTVTADDTIVIPVWYAYNENDAKSHHPSFIGTIYSKDNGNSWSAGETIKEKDLKDPSECAVALLSDGSVLLSVRNENRQKCRFFTKSPDGYSHWQHIGTDNRFPDPVCQGSMANDGKRILHLNCCSTTGRQNLTLKISADDFATFTSIPVDSCAGYSDICVIDGTAYIIYEDTTDTTDEYYTTIKFIKIVIN